MRDDLLTDVLKSVSRSFYLTLRVLPGAIRPQIGTAYLLARATDTVADTDALPANERIQVFRDLRDRITGESNAPVDLTRFSQASTAASPAEKEALARIEEIISGVRGFELRDQEAIGKVLTTIISGQELDLVRFSNARSDKIVALKTADELDDYTWRVAGCVGEFWTNLCRFHVFPDAQLDDKFMEDAVRFGKGLQLVNILRDLPRDLRAGRCYLPSDELTTIGLAPGELLSPSNEKPLRPLYNHYLDLAHEHLRQGWQYTNAIPRRHLRLRLACAWPILIGAATLQKLRKSNPLDPAQRVKVSRAEVRSIIVRSIAATVRSKAWHALFS